MTQELPPLDADIAALLKRDRLSEPFAPRGAQERAFEAIMARVAEAASVSPVSGVPGPAASRVVVPALTGVAGLIVGALLVGLLGSPPKTPATPSEIVYVPIEVPIGYPVRSDAPAPRDLGAAKAPLVSAATSASGDRLSAERTVLDAARAALASGEPSRAVALAQRHKRDFPQGALVEEREAIATKALVDTGRSAEARARGAAFERRFPQSVMLPSVRSSLATLGDAP